MAGWLPGDRRLTFGQVAELYEQARPSYPVALVEDTLSYAGMRDGARILDVGAGTGKATRLFAECARSIVALEPSAEMAQVARRACADYRQVTIVETDFENWTVPAAAFGLMISAQAWHWIDPEIRYEKARAVLQSGGALAVFWNHPDWKRCPLRGDLDRAYRDAASEFAPTGPMHPAVEFGDLISDWDAELSAVKGFDCPETRTYRWEQRYTTEQYLRLLATHSDHIVLEPEVRTRLLDRVAEAIAGHGGTLQLPYETRLCLAHAV